jgi:DNA-binding NtrC family response regulator
MLQSLQLVTAYPAGCDPQENPLGAGQQTILVADDDPAILRLLRRLLEAKGHGVLYGSNGREALQVSRDFSGGLRLVITDLDMPEMSGIEFSQQIKAERPGTPVLVISGGCSTAELPFLAKPFTPILFYKAVDQAIALTPIPGR